MQDSIAERGLIAVSKQTGERKEFVVHIGMPFWDADMEFASCPIEWHGLFDHVAPAKGIDLLHAVQQASDIDPMLEALQAKYTFYWPSGEEYFDDTVT